MRVAISTDGDVVSAHFGRCPHFTIVDLGEGKAVSRELVDNPGHHPGFIPQFLKEQGVDCIVAGGMGRRATEFFSELGIQVIVGISGRIDEVVGLLEEGALEAGESLCRPGSGKGYGLEKSQCDHPDDNGHVHEGKGEL